MDQQEIRAILEQVATGKRSVEEAIPGPEDGAL